MRANLNALKRVVLGIHKLAIRLGVYILPAHYYSPVPNILELEATKEVWAKKSELPGLSIDLDEQVANLRAICLPYRNEYTGNRIYCEGVRRHFGQGYGYIEAQALHAVIRHHRPRRILEVGSGVSTYCMLAAAEQNRKDMGQSATLSCIEPYPSDALKSLQGIELMPEQVQRVPFEEFTRLQRADMLFIDSSHTVKPGGDVNFLILEVLPRLRPGVIVHFHDIYLPYDYQRSVLRTFFHWAETSLLRAFLIFNERARIVFCLSHLHYERQDVLKQVFPEYKPQGDVHGLKLEEDKPFAPDSGHFPSSTYIEIL